MSRRTGPKAGGSGHTRSCVNDGKRIAQSTFPSFKYPITAGPIAAPAIAVAACAEATNQKCCESRISPKAATVNTPATITHARFTGEGIDQRTRGWRDHAGHAAEAGYR